MRAGRNSRCYLTTQAEARFGEIKLRVAVIVSPLVSSFFRSKQPPVTEALKPLAGRQLDSVNARAVQMKDCTLDVGARSTGNPPLPLCNDAMIAPIEFHIDPFTVEGRSPLNCHKRLKHITAGEPEGPPAVLCLSRYSANALKLCHAFRQLPQRTVKAHILINTANLASRFTAGGPSVRCRPPCGEPALDCVFLHNV